MMEKLSILSMVIGVILMMGTAGSCDLNTITVCTMVLQYVISILLIGAGFLGLKISGSECIR